MPVARSPFARSPSAPHARRNAAASASRTVGAAIDAVEAMQRIRCTTRYTSRMLVVGTA
jgi:hypothetical protein